MQNEQAYTNAWQIDRLWTTAKKLPVYFWILFILLAATLGNTLRMYYAMQDMVEAEFQKTEFQKQLAEKFNKNRDEVEAGLREQIEHLNEVIEKKTNKTAGMRLAIQRKDATIAHLVNKVEKKYVLREKANEQQHGHGD